MTSTATSIETEGRAPPPGDAATGASEHLGRASTERARPLLRHLLPVILAITAVCGGTYTGWRYWTHWRFEAGTDDAYVQADVVSIASQVAGNIASLFVDDNQHVKIGQVLAVIDQRDYEAAVEQAAAGVEQATAGIATIEAEIAQQRAVIRQVEATIDADKAQELFAKENSQRYGKLADDGYGSVQDAQQAASQIDTATAVVAKDKAALDAAKKQIETLNAQLAQAKATLKRNEAALQQARINLGYTTITSPVDGVVGDRTLRLGQYVQPGTQLLAIVPLAKIYVVANYKETQLAEVRAGQPVVLEVDAFPGKRVRGRVDSLAPASGQEFALLPPDNATGNFTKIVQRIPVKIAVDPSDPLAGMLRPGMSVTATIDTRRGATPQGSRR